ncbi:hypothetical protein DL762_002583 [Monosporascus cannonballus]|uniref:F-box domain-containing protein n=1 Tax=Monosporascus cannonballus TaxID=155416 RepID=A0ABY0HEC8_9PEZI|nr:hypothetical protein DL762_002583 [Monosporascus cannonballus]
MVTGSAPNLAHLILDGYTIIDSSTLYKWSTLTDFSGLQSLGICAFGDYTTPIQFLQQMVREGQLASLTSLSLFLGASSREGGCRLDETTSDLLLALQPLTSLDLEGEFGDGTYQAILDRHGQSLRDIRLISCRIYLFSDRIEEMRDRCPNLRSAELLIPRTQGDQNEVKIYRALGRFPRLQHLNLLLDATFYGHPVGTDDGSDAFEAKLAQQQLMNAAVDKTLALAIVRTIRQSSRLHNATRTCPLRSLKLTKTGFSESSYELSFDLELQLLRSWVGQNWVCETVPRDDGADEEVHIREIQVPGRVDREDVELAMENEKCDKVWRELWPNRTGDYRDNWSSFPLWVGYE